MSVEAIFGMARAMRQRDEAIRQRDEARAALRRYTDIVELSKEDYRAKYGSIEDYADAMDEFYRAALAVLGRDRAPAPPEGT